MNTRPTYVEELKLVGLAANAGSKEESVSLQPGHLPGGVLETSSGAAHRRNKLGSCSGYWGQGMVCREQARPISALDMQSGR